MTEELGWRYQLNTSDTVFGFRVTSTLFSHQSPYQKIEVVETPDYGRVMLIDDKVMVTDKDAFVYHEMMVHVPMAVHPDALNILVIGGGDGGTVSELTRYPGIQRVVEVEIDKDVIEASQAWFPKLSRGYADPRVELVIGDGVEYLQKVPNALFDLILIDSTDPVGPGEGLFSLDFYQNCKRVLRQDGILINQSESPYYPKQAREFRRAAEKLAGLFPIYQVYQMFIPTYESGHWLMGFASNTRHPLTGWDEAYWKAHGLSTQYYTPEVHRAAFVLPPFVREMLP